MEYILDTNHWSEIQAENPGIIGKIQALPPDARILMTVVTQAELFGGLLILPQGRRQADLRRKYEQALSLPAEILTATPAVAEEYGRIFAELRRKGSPIGAHDIWIASFARLRGATLATSDQDFGWIDGLKIEDWKAKAP